jgi:hypothetical protein
VYNIERINNYEAGKPLIFENQSCAPEAKLSLEISTSTAIYAFYKMSREGKV